MKKIIFLFVVMLLCVSNEAHALKFFEVGGLCYIYNSGTNVMLTCYSTDTAENAAKYVGDIVVPSTVEYDGNIYNVTIIDANAFAGCTGLTDVVLGDNVQEIGTNAFLNCTGLTQITIPENVAKIASNAFGKTGITTVNFNARRCFSSTEQQGWFQGSPVTGINVGDEVEMIDRYLVNGLPLLKSFHVPASVKSIDHGMMIGTTGVESLTVDPENPRYDSRDNCNAIIDTEDNAIIAGCKNTTYARDVTGIAGYAFSATPAHVVVPRNITGIGYGAFYLCQDLVTLDIQGLVRTINGPAQECPKLTRVDLPAVTTMLYDGWVQTNPALDTLFIHSYLPPKTLNNLYLRFKGDFRVIIPHSAKVNYLTDSEWAKVQVLEEDATDNYVSMVREGNEWGYCHYVRGGYGSRYVTPYSYKLQGDTIIDDVKYKKLYRTGDSWDYDTDDHYYSTTILYAVMREDGKVVYTRKVANVGCENTYFGGLPGVYKGETMKYDFNSHQDFYERWTHYESGDWPFETFVTETTDSCLLVDRTCYYVKAPSNKGRIVEGIGFYSDERGDLLSLFLSVIPMTRYNDPLAYMKTGDGNYEYYSELLCGVRDMYPYDVKRDMVVDVEDVNLLLDIVLGKLDSRKLYSPVDVNADGSVDIADVNAVEDYILNK